MKTIGWLAAVVLAALLARTLFPRTVVELVPGPPGTADTIWVTEFDLDTVFVRRTVRTSDTVNLVHTVHVTDTVYVDRLEPRWYLDRLDAPQARGDTALVSLVMLGADRGVLWRVDAVQRIWWPGPVRSVQTDEFGLHLDFYDPVPRPRTCGVGCRLQWALGGAAAGVLIGTLVP